MTKLTGPMNSRLARVWPGLGGQRIPQLDGLRGVAVLMVFVYHAFQTKLLWIGVDLFFALSGYLITAILLRLKSNARVGASAPEYWRRFYRRRASRILPPYLGFLGIVTLALGSSWAKMWYWYLLFSPNVPLALEKLPFHAMGPLWSLGVEEQFYLLWPFVVFCCGTGTIKRIALAIIVLSPLLRMACTGLFGTPTWFIYALTPFRSDGLAWGALVAACEFQAPHWVRAHKSFGQALFLVAGVFFGALSVSPAFRLHSDTILFNGLGFSLVAALCAGCLISVLAAERGGLHRILTSVPLRYIGLISYSFYLYHVLILDTLRRQIHSDLSCCLVAFPALVVFCSLSWRFFELPILNRLGSTQPGCLLSGGVAKC